MAVLGGRSGSAVAVTRGGGRKGTRELYLELLRPAPERRPFGTPYRRRAAKRGSMCEYALRKHSESTGRVPRRFQPLCRERRRPEARGTERLCGSRAYIYEPGRVYYILAFWLWFAWQSGRLSRQREGFEASRRLWYGYIVTLCKRRICIYVCTGASGVSKENNRSIICVIKTTPAREGRRGGERRRG